MMRNLQILIVCLLATTKTFAHFYWLETNSNGKVGQEQNIKIFFGEYKTQEIEKTNGEVYQNNAKNFVLYLIDNQGNKTELQTTPKDNHYIALFTPKAKGVHTIVLDNENYEVLDYTKYDYGIFKPNYQSITQIRVGEEMETKLSLNPESITIVPLFKDKTTTKLQVLFKNKPLPNKEVTLFHAKNKSKTLKTNKKGVITFNITPNSNQKYIVEATHEDTLKGVFKGKDYQFTWHCAVFTIN